MLWWAVVRVEKCWENYNSIAKENWSIASVNRLPRQIHSTGSAELTWLITLATMTSSRLWCPRAPAAQIANSVFHSFRSQVRWDAWSIDILRSLQSSWILSSHFLVFLFTDVHACDHGVASLEICRCLSGSLVQNVLIFELATNQRCPFRLTILSICLYFFFYS